MRLTREQEKLPWSREPHIQAEEEWDLEPDRLFASQETFDNWNTEELSISCLGYRISKISNGTYACVCV